MSGMPFYPTDHCSACGAPRPFHHACPCGDPGGMPRTLPERWPKWSKTERHLYAGQSVRVMGEVDRSGAMLVCFLSGPLGEAGECRWMSWAELAANGDAAMSAPEDAQGTERHENESDHVYGQVDAAEGVTAREGGAAA